MLPDLPRLVAGERKTIVVTSLANIGRRGAENHCCYLPYQDWSPGSGEPLLLPHLLSLVAGSGEPTLLLPHLPILVAGERRTIYVTSLAKIGRRGAENHCCYLTCQYWSPGSGEPLLSPHLPRLVAGERRTIVVT